MSLKSIDMQFAIHKNVEVSSKQSSIQNQPQNDQAMLSAAQAKVEAHKRSLAPEVSETETGVNKRAADSNLSGDKQMKHQNRKNGRTMDKEVDSQPDHPFKGRHIDLSL